MTFSLTHRLAAASLIAVTCASYAVIAPLGATAGTAPRADTDPPFSRNDPSGDVQVYRLAGTGVTGRQARAVDITRVDWDVVTRGGQRTIRVRTTIARVLRESNRYRQTIQTSADEEYVLRTYLPSGRTLFRSSYGGPADTAPGCNRLEGEVDGRVVTQYMPKRCLPAEGTPLVPQTELRSAASGKLLSYDAPRNAPFQVTIDW